MRSQIRPWKLSFAVILLAIAAIAAPGCGGPSGSSECDAQAQCEFWPPSQVNNCYASADNDSFLADRLGCGPFLDQLLSCEDATGFCSGGRNWETSCGRERDNFNHCVGK